MRFVFLGPRFRLRLPSDSASRRTPLPSATRFPLPGAPGTFTPWVCAMPGTPKKVGRFADLKSLGGDVRIRTGDKGFAGLCLTTWPRRHMLRAGTRPALCIAWSGLRGSNPRPQPWQGCALPTALSPRAGINIRKPPTECKNFFEQFSPNVPQLKEHAGQHPNRSRKKMMCTRCEHPSGPSQPSRPAKNHASARSISVSGSRCTMTSTT